MVTFPNAKINLGLNIIGKRQDGYHNLVSCFYPVPWHDMLEMVPASKLEITFSGLPIEGDVRDNLCMKAYQLMAKDFQLPPVKIHLHKSIPMGAGLGGGSADGAFMIRMLNEHFNLFLEPEILEEYAAAIGSDSIFFIQNKPVLVKGRGEIFEELKVDLRGFYLVLACPPIHVPTREAYGNLKRFSRDQGQVRKTIENKPVKEWKQFLQNDFEDSVFELHPEIGEIKEKLYQEGALYASMTGSGAAVYGIFGQPAEIPQDLFPGAVIFQKML